MGHAFGCGRARREVLEEAPTLASIKAELDNISEVIDALDVLIRKVPRDWHARYPLLLVAITGFNEEIVQPAIASLKGAHLDHTRPGS